MNAKQRRTQARASLHSVGGKGAKAVLPSGKQCFILGKGNKAREYDKALSLCVEVLRGDKRKVNICAKMLTRA